MLSNNRAGELTKFLKFIFLVCLTICCNIGCYSKLTFALSSEQPISIKFDNAPIDVIVQEVERQTGFKIYIDYNLQNEFFTGEYDSVDLTTFLRNLFKNKSTFITVSMDSKTVFVNTVSPAKAKPVVKESESNNTELWRENSERVPSYSTNKASDNIINDPRYGGVYELPPPPVPKSPSNNKHLIDYQTGLEWESAEKLL